MNQKYIKAILAKKTFIFFYKLAKVSENSYSFVGPFDPRKKKNQ